MNYTPSRWGQEFHALTVDEALAGGSAGPGKSLALLMDPMEQVVVQHKRCEAGEFRWGRAPGWALHLRREYTRLEETIARSIDLFPKVDPGAKYDTTTHRWTWSSGYKFSFGHLKDADSFLNYRSNEYTHLGIDEVGEIESKDIYDELALRVRTTDPVLSKMLKVRCTSNPTANWVRSYFVDPNPNGRQVFLRRIRLMDGSYRTRTRMFLPALLKDNPNAEFRLQYETSLQDRPPHIRDALLHGNWYVVAGAFFAELWDPSRVVIKPFKIPSGWRRFRSGDWGYKQECVILWWAVSPDDELICYRERTFNGTKAKKRHDAIAVAQEIREIEKMAGEWNFMRNHSRLTGPMDTQLWEERGRSGHITMADDMAGEGVFWIKATKGRKQAAQQIIKRLGDRGYNDRPGMMFFETCNRCISTIPALGTDETDPEAPRKGGADHWYDAVSYAAAANIRGSGENDRSGDDDEFDEPTATADRGRYGYGGN